MTESECPTNPVHGGKVPPYDRDPYEELCVALGLCGRSDAGYIQLIRNAIERSDLVVLHKKA